MEFIRFLLTSWSVGYCVPIVTITLVIIYRTLNGIEFPGSMQWVGKPHGPFSVFIGSLKSFCCGLETSKTGYEKFSKKGRPFIVPFSDFKPRVILPPQHIRWILSQPQHILSHDKMIVEQFAFNYTMPGAHERDFGIQKILGKELTRNFPKVYSAFLEELQSAIDETLGLDATSWKTLNIYSTMGNIISRANRRVILGESLCRDKEIIYHTQQYIRWFGIMLIFLGQLLPQVFRPLFGVFLGIPLKYHRRVLERRLQPVFKERLRLLREKGDIPCADEIPQDIITWSTKVALDSNKADAQNPEFLARQFIESIFSTTEALIATATNFFSDILSSESDQVLADLREEARSVFSPGEMPCLYSLKKLYLADSAVRETLRRNPFSIYGLFHEVMPKEGVVTPSGHHLPQGTWISVPTWAIHHDERLYSEPDRYDPYRFMAGTDSKYKSMLTTITENFLGFSLGDHACPGRIYASYLLKSMIAYIMLKYEFRLFSTRPANRAVGVIYVPPVTAEFSFRRTGAAS